MISKKPRNPSAREWAEPGFKDKDRCESPLFNFCLYDFQTLFFWGEDRQNTHTLFNSLHTAKCSICPQRSPGRLENTHHQSLGELMLFLLACCMLTQRDLGDVQSTLLCNHAAALAPDVCRLRWFTCANNGCVCRASTAAMTSTYPCSTYRSAYYPQCCFNKNQRSNSIPHWRPF